MILNKITTKKMEQNLRNPNMALKILSRAEERSKSRKLKVIFY